jgi:leader peptidase (prepilin peptidase)/N-methyltransferase
MGDLSISLIITAIVLSLSLILVFIDIEYREIPDSVSLLALVLSFFILLPDIQQTIEVIKNGLIFMGAITLLRFLVSFIMDREAMGEGDIIVAGIIGSLLGGIGGLKAIFFAALFALPINAYSKYKLGTEEVAFVPFLFIGLFVQYFVEF